MATCFCTKLPLILLGGRKTLHQVHWMAPRGWMLGNVWLYISFQNRQQEPRLAVRGNGTGPTDYISTNGLRFPPLPGRLCCYVMSLGVTHSEQAGKSVKGRRRQMAPALFPRLSQVGESQTLEARHKLVATQPPTWWAWPFQVYFINRAQVWKYLEYQRYHQQLSIS